MQQSNRNLFSFSSIAMIVFLLGFSFGCSKESNQVLRAGKALEENLNDWESEIDWDLNYNELAFGVGMSNLKVNDFKIGMKVLFLSATENEQVETTLGLAKDTLTAFGIPFDHFVMSNQPSNFKLPLLDEQGNPRYYAVIFTTNELAYEKSPGQFASAIDPEQKALLEQYMTNFGVRLVSLYSFPNPKLGVKHYTNHNSTSNNTILLSAATRSNDPSLKAGLTFPISKQWHYSAYKIRSDIQITPYLTYQNQSLAASINSFKDGRQELHFYFTQGRYYKHSLALTGAWINWVTRGLFQGKRRVYLNTQITKVFSTTNLWDPKINAARTDGTLNYRLTPQDLEYFNTWQKNTFNKLVANNNFKVELAFNAQELWKDGTYSRDALYTKVPTLKDKFNWATQIFPHNEQNVDTVTAEVNIGRAIAKDLFGDLSFANYSEKTFVSPNVASLLNESAVSGFVSNQIPYVSGDQASIKDLHLGYYSNQMNDVETELAGEKFYIIPRHSTIVYFNTANSTQLTSEYNLIFKNQFPKPSTFTEIMAREASRVGLMAFNYNALPFVFHQANLATFVTGGVRYSLVGIWLQEVVEEIRTVHTLPILSLKSDDLARELEQKSKLKDCEVQSNLEVAQGKFKRIMLLNQHECTVSFSTTAFKFLPSTGTVVETYGPDKTITSTLTQDIIELQ